MKSKTNRIVRLNPIYSERVYGRVLVPELKISGLWMAEQGFEAGAMVDISVRHGELVIRPVVQG